MLDRRERLRFLPRPALLALALAAGPPRTAGGEGWTDLEPPPTPRQEVGVAELGGAIYVIGGILEDRAPTAIVERYLTHEGRWERIADLPRALHHVGAASLGGRIHALGGLDGSFQGVDSCFSYSSLFLAADLLECDDAADVNDDGNIDIADPIHLLGNLFLGEPPPAPPAGESGDPTPDLLGCARGS